MENQWLVALIVTWGICGFLGGIVGNRVNRPVPGFLLGFGFGPLGVITAFALNEVSPQERKSRALQSPSKRAAAAASMSQFVHFTCHKCGNQMAALASAAGTEDKCGRCGTVIVIPDPWIPPTPPKPVSKLMECPDCGREVSRRAAACPHCGCPLQG